MHRQFVRLFVSIALIIILALLLLLGLLSLYGSYLIRQWKEGVFDEFAISLASNLDNVSFDSSTLSIDLFNTDISERISGFIMRSSNGQILTFGTSGRGLSFSLYGDKEDETHTVYSLRKSKYRIDVETESSFNFNIKNLNMSEVKNLGKEDVVFPSSVDGDDIAGSIDVFLNGELYVTLYVLVYSLDYYTPTQFVLRQVYFAILFSIPLVLIFSLLFAYIVSSKSSKRVEKVEMALSSLSKGDYDVVFQNTNISEYERIYKSIENLGQDLKRHSKSRKEWIRNISHDLNTPVSSIKILLDGAEDGVFPINMELISSIKNENNSLEARIKSISYYSYLLSPDVVCNKRSVLVLPLVLNITQSMDLDVALSIKEEDEVSSDESLLQRALIEGIKNASEYGENISLECIKSENKTSILIKNKGTLPRPLPQFFEPWSRGDEAREKGGCGMGLPIIYQIMEINGGSVTIEEKDGIVVLTLTFLD